MTKRDAHVYLAYIGTTKIVFLKASAAAETTEITAYCARLARGFSHGVVQDLKEATETLREAVRSVVTEEEAALVPCRVVISNAYLKNYVFQSSLYFHTSPHALTIRDVRAAIAQTRSVATIPLDEIIVQAVPQEFLVNDLAGIRNPIGLEASRLGVTLRILTMNYLVYSNLMKVWERADLEVSEVIPGALASSEAVLNPVERQDGVILVVIGGGATHFACYKNSVLAAVHSIPFGSDRVTEVIAQKLNLNHLDAQRIKESFGSAHPKVEFQEELIPLPQREGERKRSISRREFEHHLSGGLDEFFGEITKQVKALQAQFAPLDQVVFTGGGAELDGFLDVLQERIPVRSRIGIPEGFSGPAACVKRPAFAAPLGGLHFTSKILEPALPVQNPQNWLGRTTESVRSWIFEYL